MAQEKTGVKPIETVYQGWKFRSRLEARWAVFLTELKIKWQYEAEGFDLGAGLWYLPDFYLPEARCWAEVKPGPFSREEEHKIKLLVAGTHEPCLLLVGPPDLRPYGAWAWYRNRLTKTEYILLPNRLSPVDLPLHSDSFGSKYIAAVRAARSARFKHRGALLPARLPGYLTHAFSLALDTLLSKQEKAGNPSDLAFWQSARRWLERFIPTQEAHR